MESSVAKMSCVCTPQRLLSCAKMAGCNCHSSFTAVSKLTWGRGVSAAVGVVCSGMLVMACEVKSVVPSVNKRERASGIMWSIPGQWLMVKSKS